MHHKWNSTLELRSFTGSCFIVLKITVGKLNKIVFLTFFCSQIDYCNSLLVGVSKIRLSPKVGTLCCCSRLIARLSCYSHTSFIKEHLYWLPISTHIEYKILLFILKAQLGVAPKSLQDCIRSPWPGQLCPSLDLLLSLALLCAIGFCWPLVLLSFLQSFYVFISSENLSTFLELVAPKAFL